MSTALAPVLDLTSVNEAAPISTGARSWLTYTGLDTEIESASDAVTAVVVGVAPILFAGSVDSVSRVDWSTVCPLTPLAKPILAVVARIAAKKGDNRISLRSFSTSTHHVYFESEISVLFVVHCPSSVASFSDSPNPWALIVNSRGSINCSRIYLCCQNSL